MISGSHSLACRLVETPRFPFWLDSSPVVREAARRPLSVPESPSTDVSCGVWNLGELFARTLWGRSPSTGMSGTATEGLHYLTQRTLTGMLSHPRGDRWPQRKGLVRANEPGAAGGTRPDEGASDAAAGATHSAWASSDLRPHTALCSAQCCLSPPRVSQRRKLTCGRTVNGHYFG